MKITTLLFGFLLLSISAFAQKVSIENAIDNIGGAYNSSYRVFVPHADMKLLEKRWTRFLKDNDAKVKTPKGEINGQNAIIKGIGPDSLQIFSHLQEGIDGVQLIVAIERKGAFIKPDDSYAAKSLDKLLRDFAKGVAVEAIGNKTEIANDELESKQKEKNSLDRSNKRLSESIEEMQKTILENQKTIESNTKRLDQLKGEIENAKNAVEAIKSKSKDLE